ncbi:primosomal protein N' [Nocardia albiluteola]|uniref:primosomal protein N' n=1 Tax=Nocardia albiluteola TaxID=2842303 RepID=UPI001FD90B8D|nr:primosomal protein N' [Nocardia albiluteola]
MLEPAHLDRDFDYLVPPEMDELAQPGVRVRVRFSGRLIDGFLLERLETSDHTGKLMRLERVVSGERVLTPEILRLVAAVAARYAGTRADVLRLAIPPRHARTEAAQPKSAAKSGDEMVDLDAPVITPPAIDAPVAATVETVIGAIADESGLDAAQGNPRAEAEADQDRRVAVGEAESGSIAELSTGGAAEGGSEDSGDEESTPGLPQKINASVRGANSAKTGVNSVEGESGSSGGPLTRAGVTEGGPDSADFTASAAGGENEGPTGAVEGGSAGGSEAEGLEPGCGGMAGAGEEGANRSEAESVSLSGRQEYADAAEEAVAGAEVGVTAPGAGGDPDNDVARSLEGPAPGAVGKNSAGGSEAEGLEPGRGRAAGAGEAGANRSEGEQVSALDETNGSGAADSGGVRTAAVLERFPGWERYRHGGSFLGALAEGKGPRAAWQALPGEDWATRLAELAAVVVDSGRGAVIMVPDQRDLDRVLAACAELVGDAAVGLAAGLGPAARYRRWLAALRGSARIVVGTRSAVFAPVRDLGLIAIWDDGDDTFAEPRAPYPHAREIAMLRAHESGAAFVAGGFARTAEVQAIIASGWAHDLVADRATVRQCAPRISAPGDSDVALERDPVARAVRIPAVAFTAARKALAAGEPVLVQVPRRGYVPALSCAKCRTPARCRHCNGPLALPDEHGDRAAARRPTGSRPDSAAARRERAGRTAAREEAEAAARRGRAGRSDVQGEPQAATGGDRAAGARLEGGGTAQRYPGSTDRNEGAAQWDPRSDSPAARRDWAGYSGAADRNESAAQWGPRSGAARGGGMDATGGSDVVGTGARGGGDRFGGPQRNSARDLGVALSRSGSGEIAHSPSCRWCGKTDAAFRCSTCGARALRAVVIGAARTAEELGRAFPGVPIRGSGGAAVLDSVAPGPQVVVSTIGAEPVVEGGYAVALLLDGWALLGRADLRAAEDTLRRWMSAATLVRSSGQVIVMADPAVPTVQALVRWDPVTHADFELAARTEVRFPPAVRLAALDGTTDSIAELLGEAQLPAGVEILGPVPLPPGARKPFSAGDTPAEVERMILRTDRGQGAALSRALSAALAVRSTHRSDAPLRVQIDPIDIG